MCYVCPIEKEIQNFNVAPIINKFPIIDTPHYVLNICNK